MGKLSVPAFHEIGKDERSTLAASFQRMRRSLIKAMKMLKDKSPAGIDWPGGGIAFMSKS
ncbi:MAG: hypothetical protein PVF28_07270 [Thioalkalispiraceae bacterium]|jgi:hypothetical protein